jgi:hypothetical protein
MIGFRRAEAVLFILSISLNILADPFSLPRMTTYLESTFIDLSHAIFHATKFRHKKS